MFGKVRTWGPMVMETSQGCDGARLALPIRLVLAAPCSSSHSTPACIKCGIGVL